MNSDTLYVDRTVQPTVFYIIKDGEKCVCSEEEIRWMSFKSVVFEEYLNGKEVCELIKSWRN